MSKFMSPDERNVYINMLHKKVCKCGEPAVIYYGAWEIPMCEHCAIDLLVMEANKSTKDNHKNWPAGTLVTTKVAQKGYGANAGRNGRMPNFYFEPGMIGVVHSTPPPVTGRRSYFLCVDWCCPVTGHVERCALWPEDAKKIKKVK